MIIVVLWAAQKGLCTISSDLCVSLQRLTAQLTQFVMRMPFSISISKEIMQVWEILKLFEELQSPLCSSSCVFPYNWMRKVNIIFLNCYFPASFQFSVHFLQLVSLEFLFF